MFRTQHPYYMKYFKYTVWVNLIVELTKKGKFVPCCRHECTQGEKMYTPLILNLRLYMEVRGELKDTAVLPPGRNTGTPWIGDWVGPRAGLDISEEKISWLYWIYTATKFAYR
jgi:hypothetical protein